MFLLVRKSRHEDRWNKIHDSYDIMDKEGSIWDASYKTFEDAMLASKRLVGRNSTIIIFKAVSITTFTGEPLIKAIDDA